jgi:gas vesicle protein
MADRFDNGEGGGFVIGLLTGTALGIGLGMLFAPKAGAELRGQLSEQAGALANQAQDGYRKVTQNAGQWAEKSKETAGEWAERGKDMYGKVREAVSRGAEEAETSVREAAATAAGATTASATTGSAGSSASRSPSTYGSSGSAPASSSYSDSPSGRSGATSGGGGPRRS